MEPDELWAKRRRSEGSKGAVQIVPDFHAPRCISIEQGEIGLETWPITWSPMPSIRPMFRLVDYTNVIVIIPDIGLNEMSVVLGGDNILQEFSGDLDAGRDSRPVYVDLNIAHGLKERPPNHGGRDCGWIGGVLAADDGRITKWYSLEV